MRSVTLPVIALLMLAAPLAQRVLPTDVIRVEDPEPLPDVPKGRTAPPTVQAPAGPAVQMPQPVTPDSRIVLPPEHPAPPAKASTSAPK